MLPLLNAIFSAFTSTLSATFPGGMHRDAAPEGTAMPYVVSHVASSKLEYAYGGPYRAAIQIRFTVFGVGHDATAVTIQALIAAFDDTLLPLSSGTNDSVTRLGDPIPKLHQHDAAGNDVWEWAVGYEYNVVF